MSKFELYLKEAEEAEQKYKSAGTSINVSKLPATFKKLEALGFVKPGMVIADLGGGKYDNAIEWASQRDSHLYVVDPYNRTPEYNEESISKITKAGADIVTINNVLNVIQEDHNRIKILQDAYRYLKTGGKCCVLIYEGDKSGVGKETQKGQSWQNNKKTSEYLDEVRSVFDNVQTKAGMIIGEK